jgi:hypothetical protein
VRAEVARLNGALAALREGRVGLGSGVSTAAAAAIELMLLEAVTTAAPGAGGKTTELFLPTVARTFDTASFSVVITVVGVEVVLGGGTDGVAGELTDKVGSDGLLDSKAGNSLLLALSWLLLLDEEGVAVDGVVGGVVVAAAAVSFGFNLTTKTSL